jgi:hypothetical protein
MRFRAHEDRWESRSRFTRWKACATAASQDAEPARLIAAFLTAAEVEVWFGQSELVGGGAWDQKIRKQIKECASFVFRGLKPSASVRSSRLARYFSLSTWKFSLRWAGNHLVH